MQAIESTAFGVISIVFFRRHAETKQPIMDDPQVWVYDREDHEAARADLERLRSQAHLYVPGGITLASIRDAKSSKPARRQFKFGDVLPNGATVIECVPVRDDMPNGHRLVIARFGDEYVVWLIDDEGNAENGNYLNNLADAVDRLAKRRRAFN